MCLYFVCAFSHFCATPNPPLGLRQARALAGKKGSLGMHCLTENNGMQIPL